jgi:hypothetical protein
MPRKLNCWEFKNCGRERGGLLAEVLGECPVPKALKYDGLNDGQGAGRACWMVPNSAGRSHLRPGCRANPCLECEFYQRVLFEEADDAVFKLVDNVSPTP